MEKPGTRNLISKTAPEVKAALVFQTIILGILFSVKIGFVVGALYEFIFARNSGLGWDCVWACVIFCFLF